VSSPLTLSRADARRFHRRAVLLDGPRATLAATLDHLAWIQIDPINVCGRMQDLILRNRVAGYREGDLMRHLHGGDTVLSAEQRTAFEHHHPGSHILVAFSCSAWPYLHAEMDARSRRTGAWSGRLTPREKQLSQHILKEIETRGPLSSDAIDDDRVARKVWGQASLAKATLQKLFFHGRVLIAARKGSRRFYDLPERVMPASWRTAPRPNGAEIERWLAVNRLRQHRLVCLRRTELSRVADLVQSIRIEGAPLLHCLREDLPLLDLPEPNTKEVAPTPLLLAPLDPLIYDRKITSTLWDFHYRWEVYTPAHRRVRGYYALPVLAETGLVGHADLKSDRARNRLIVMSCRVRRGVKATPAVRTLAHFLGLKGVGRPTKPAAERPNGGDSLE
jgi:uncharacterized protein YcaQ